MITASFNNLKTYCEKENFSGWDPYDGLNSKVFNSLPFKKLDLARLAWIQGFKRSPVNFRRIFLVPKQHNAKGIGLFLSGYCNLYKRVQAGGSTEFGTASELLEKIHYLASLLLTMQSKGYSGACWGYNFDWQARRMFLFPKHTPTVVATTFCASALMDAYELSGEKKYLEAALSSAQFVLKDLHRTPTESGFLFSYSPLKGNDTVYNASLLGSKLLARCYSYTHDETMKAAAAESVQACVQAQNPDGSWFYGSLAIQQWIDSFHTGYNLDALSHYMQYTGDTQYISNLEKGFEFYLKHFFESDGTPKYYHDKTYPIDIHCPGQLLVTLHVLNAYDAHSALADKVLQWTIDHMQSRKGYFYYQLKKGMSSKIPYMRWSNAFMFHAMTCYLMKAKNNSN